MAGRQRKYTIDVAEVEELIALAEVTGEVEEGKSLLLACHVFGIKLDDAKISDKAAQFELVAQKLSKRQKK